jgi:hypothetical protein
VGPGGLGPAAGTGAAGRRVLRLQAPASFNAESSAKGTQTGDVSHWQQQPISAGSAVSQYEQPPGGGPGRLHVYQALRTGLRDGTARRAAGHCGQYSNISSGRHSRVHVRSQSGIAIGQEARRATSQLRGPAVVFKLHRAAPTKGCLNCRGGSQPPANGLQ